jgi:hypothetical protein
MARTSLDHARQRLAAHRLKAESTRDGARLRRGAARAEQRRPLVAAPGADAASREALRCAVSDAQERAHELAVTTHMLIETASRLRAEGADIIRRTHDHLRSRGGSGGIGPQAHRGDQRRADAAGTPDRPPGP